MEYFVSMNERELKISMLLQERISLENVVTVEEDFQYDRELLETMAAKNFLQKDEKGYHWNSFVEMILRIVFSADSVMEQSWKGQGIFHFYFKDSAVVLLCKREEDPQYVFYLVSLVPKMIGAMAKQYEALEERMAAGAPEGDVEPEILPADPLMESLGSYLTAQKKAEASQQLLHIRTVDDLQDYCAVVYQEGQKYYLAQKKDQQIRILQVDYYSMIEEISKEMIRLHGESIKKGDPEQWQKSM